jgi:hypothetical protein
MHRAPLFIYLPPSSSSAAAAVAAVVVAASSSASSVRENKMCLTRTGRRKIIKFYEPLSLEYTL